MISWVLFSDTVQGRARLFDYSANGKLGFIKKINVYFYGQTDGTGTITYNLGLDDYDNGLIIVSGRVGGTQSYFSFGLFRTTRFYAGTIFGTSLVNAKDLSFIGDKAFCITVTDGNIPTNDVSKINAFLIA